MARPDAPSPGTPSPDAGWRGLFGATTAILAPLLILLGVVAVLGIGAAVWPTPPTLGPVWPTPMAGARADTAGWSESDKRAVLEAAETDLRHFGDAMRTDADGTTEQTGLRAAPDSVSWTGLEAYVEAEMQTRGLSRDTAFQPFQGGSASRAGRWTYSDWAGGHAAAAVALIEVPRPSTGERVRFIVQAWSNPDK